MEQAITNERPHEEVLDDVYLKYAACDPFIPITHFIDHSTMGSEALVALGLGDKVREWIARHEVRPYKPPTTGVPIASEWKAALGRPECHGDWLSYFENELRETAPQVVLASWVPHFAHDVGALLFHGLIRTAHAARALDHRDTWPRRAELARGLALWAIGIRTPTPDTGPGTQPMPSYEAEILNYARAGAATFIRHPDIPRLHLVTGPMAYLMIAKQLDPTVHAMATASFAKTHSMAIQAFDALKDKALDARVPALDQSELDELAHGQDAHPIKLTEAALRAFKKTGEDIFLKAAGKARNLHSLRNLALRLLG